MESSHLAAAQLVRYGAFDLERPTRLPRGRRACLTTPERSSGRPVASYGATQSAYERIPAETLLTFHPTGAKLPSFALIAVRGEEDRMVITMLGDEPRKPSSLLVAAVTAPVTSS